jgi:molybdopterin synthase catalytic subunit
MKKIADRAAERWPLSRIVMHHVTGEKAVGDAVVVVGASSAHRQAAFEACRFLIDELKATVPIWKKEFYTDSSIWVAAHP